MITCTELDQVTEATIRDLVSMFDITRLVLRPITRSGKARSEMML